MIKSVWFTVLAVGKSVASSSRGEIHWNGWYGEASVAGLDGGGKRNYAGHNGTISVCHG